VPYTVAPNPSPSARSGTITVGSDTVQNVQLSQAPAPCQFTLGRTSDSIPAAGGNASVTVSAMGGCAWTATSEASWISVTSGQTGSGNGTVSLSISANTGAQRSGQVMIAGQQYTATQGSVTPAACAFTLSRTGDSIAASGGTSSVGVTAAAGCAWAATSGASWITVLSGQAGSGNGTVTLSFAANPGTQRTGQVTIAGQIYTATQSAAPICTYEINRTSDTFAAGGGTTTVGVSSQGGCAWTAVSGAAWITVTSGANGSGNGNVGLTIASNPGVQRTGQVTIAGHTYTATQDAASISFSGTISGLAGSCPNISFTAGSNVTANNTTTYSGGKCTDLRNGMAVTVTANETGTPNVTATNIKLEK